MFEEVVVLDGCVRLQRVEHARRLLVAESVPNAVGREESVQIDGGDGFAHGQQEALIARRGQACGLDEPRPQVVKARALVRDALRLAVRLARGLRRSPR